MNRTDLKPYFVVLIATLISWWLVQWQDEQQTKLEIAENSPDFFSNAYYKKEMGLDGLIKSELNADYMQHNRNDGSTSLTKPVMILYNNRQSPWLLKSETALMAADGDNLQLNGAAYIHRDASPSADELTVNTRDLRVKLSSHYAETQARSEIIGPPNRTIGSGMKVTYASPIHLTLLSEVKGRYELNK